MNRQERIRIIEKSTRIFNEKFPEHDYVSFGVGTVTLDGDFSVEELKLMVELLGSKIIVYRIYTRVNLAETSRDDDDIVIKELCHIGKRQDAIDFANDYIQKNFAQVKFAKARGIAEPNKIKVVKEKDKNVWSRLEECSWGEKIIVEEITVKASL